MAEKKKLREWGETIIWAIALALFIRAIFIQAYKIPTGSMQPTLLGKGDYRTGDHLLVNKFIYGSAIPFTGLERPLRLPAIRSPYRGDVVVFKYPKNPKHDYVKRCIGLPGETITIRDKKVYINGEYLDEHSMWLTKFPQLNYYQRANSFEDARLSARDNFGPLYIPQKGDRLILTRQTITVITTGSNGLETNVSPNMAFNPNNQLHRRYEVKEGKTLTERAHFFYSDMYGQGDLIQNDKIDITLTDDYYFVMGDNRDNSADSRYWGLLSNQYLRGIAVVVYWPPRWLRKANKQGVPVHGAEEPYYHGLRVVH